MNGRIIETYKEWSSLEQAVEVLIYCISWPSLRHFAWMCRIWSQVTNKENRKQTGHLQSHSKRGPRLIVAVISKTQYLQDEWVDEGGGIQCQITFRAIAKNVFDRIRIRICWWWRSENDLIRWKGEDVKIEMSRSHDIKWSRDMCHVTLLPCNYGTQNLESKRDKFTYYDNHTVFSHIYIEHINQSPAICQIRYLLFREFHPRLSAVPICRYQG